MYKGDLCLPYFYIKYIKTLDKITFMYYNITVNKKYIKFLGGSYYEKIKH